MLINFTNYQLLVSILINFNCQYIKAINLPIEHHLVTTDSSSDIHKSSASKGASIKEVCLIIDEHESEGNSQHRKIAKEQVKKACESVSCNLQILEFGKLDFVSNFAATRIQHTINGTWIFYF